MVYKDPANDFYNGLEIIIYKYSWQVKNIPNIITSLEIIPEERKINLRSLKGILKKFISAAFLVSV